MDSLLYTNVVVARYSNKKCTQTKTSIRGSIHWSESHRTPFKIFGCSNFQIPRAFLRLVSCRLLLLLLVAEEDLGAFSCLTCTRKYPSGFGDILTKNCVSTLSTFKTLNFAQALGEWEDIAPLAVFPTQQTQRQNAEKHFLLDEVSETPCIFKVYLSIQHQL